MKKMLIVGPTYKNLDTGRLYTIQNFCQIKVAEDWVGGVVYISIESTGKTFVEEVNDFVQQFEIVKK
mgnify:FL=1|tara:strand:- start:1437 stop:1637 length:201 start_codon:yes stop_codon:yes gene_type:complete